MTFELIENFRGNEKNINFIIKDFSFNAFKASIDRNYDMDEKSILLKEYSLKQKRSCYTRLINYAENIVKNEYKVKTIYNKNRCGRYYAQSNMNLQILPNEIRGFFCRGIMTDVDIKNAQPTVIRWICKKYNILCPYLDLYVKDRESILNNNELDKITIIAAMNSSKMKHSIKNKFFNEFDREMKNIQKELYDKEEFKFIVDTINDEDRKRNLYGIFINRIYFHYESEIIIFLKTLLEDQKIYITSYNFDGLMVKENLTKNTKILVHLITEIRARFDLDEYFALTYKEQCEIIQIPKDWIENPEKEDEESAFKRISVDFELSHCKIINENLYIKECNDEYLIMNRATIRGAYCHLACGFNMKTGNIVGFIDKWLGVNESIRKFNSMNIYPKESLCPDNIFNLWKPFSILSSPSRVIEGDKTVSEDIGFILKHLLILCNNDLNVYNYFLSWMGQMVQYPERKSVCITFISKEGAGKGTLLYLFRRMFGDKKILETADPLKEVFGQFNGRMKDTFLINFNEIGISDMKPIKNKMKNLITDGKIEINPKNIDPYEIDSYHRCLITTNNEEPIVVSKDTRRDVVIRCSDELIKNKSYFTKIYALLNDDNIVRDFYDALMALEGLDKFGELPLPITEYQQNLSDLSVSVVEQWIQDWTIENIDNKERIISMTSDNLYNEFICWRDKNKITYDITSLKLLCRISNLPIDGIKKKRITIKRWYEFNIDKLMKHYGIIKEVINNLVIDISIIDEECIDKESIEGKVNNEFVKNNI